MGQRACCCFEKPSDKDASVSNHSERAATRKENERFSDAWFRKYDQPTGWFEDRSGKKNRFPLRLESTEVMVYGLVDAKEMWSEFEALDEPFVPILVGGKAVVSIWFNNFIDTDCGGSYLETWYNTFVTAKGEPQLELPYDSHMSAVIQDPRCLVYLQRVLCSESPVSTGAGQVAIEGGRAIWGFPKHPELANIRFAYTNNDKRVEFDATHMEKSAVKLSVDIPTGDDNEASIPLELELPPDANIGGPRNGGTHTNHNGCHQTRYATAIKCTQHVKRWDSKVDSITFGDDAHYALPISKWKFEPVLKVHSPDFKIIAHAPSNWISGSEAAAKQAPDSKERFSDDWFRKYDVPDAGYMDCSGKLNRLPLRLQSTEVMVYGLVDAEKMWSDFEKLNEPFQPILVGGKAVVSIWFNNFIDTDCGGSYLETWYNTFVTDKGEPQLELPYESHMSLVIQDPRTKVYLQRVICSESPKTTGAGKVAIEGGRAIFGFPKHPELAEIRFEYKNVSKKAEFEDGKKVEFEATHLGKKVVTLGLDIPMKDDADLEIPLELEVPATANISGPRNGGTHANHNGAHQTTYKTAIKCTQHMKAWDPETDSIEFGDDGHYARPIKGWDFEPILKVHSPDFKIVAHKPSNWQ